MKDKRVKREKKMLIEKVSKLTEEQRKVKEELRAWMEYGATEWETERPEKEWLLLGCAGTGKTTLIIELVQEFIKEWTPCDGEMVWNEEEEEWDYAYGRYEREIHIVAPTHKAVAVLKQKLPEELGAKCLTIHSLLSLVPEEVRLTKTERERKEELERERERDEKEDEELQKLTKKALEEMKGVTRLVNKEGLKIKDRDLIIVDECSMISDELYAELQEKLKEFANLQVLYVGDEAQLRPVQDGLGVSPTLKTLNKSELKTVMRHAGLILEVANNLRTKPRDFAQALLKFTPDVSYYTEYGEFYEEVEKAYREGEDAIVLAYRNATVNTYNQEIRNRLYPQEKEPYVEGERLRTTATIRSNRNNRGGYFKNKYVESDMDEKIDWLLPSAEELRILKVCGRHEPKDLGLPIRTDNIVLWNVIVRSTYGEQTFKINLLDPDYYEVYERTKSDLQVMGKAWATKAKTGKGKMMWGIKEWEEIGMDVEEFKKLKAKYYYMAAQVSYAYALTVHKSQGSTFETVFLDVPDIVGQWNKDDARRCLYTAATRASKKLISFYP